MDLITQAALGAVVGELVLGKKLGRSAIGWGALFGVLPDSDAILAPFLDTAWDLRIHRGLSHSLLLTLILTFALAKPLAKRWKKQKVTPQRAGCFVFLVWSTHVLIDCFTVYGTQVLWPFPGDSVSFDNLFIIDPLFTVPLLVAVIWGLFIKAPQWKKGLGVRMAAICLGISCVYVGLSFGAKSAVSSAVKQDLVRRGVTYERKMEAPAPFGILLWRCLIERDGEIWMSYRSLLDGDEPLVWTIFPRHEEVLDQWCENPDAWQVREVRRFSKDWCIARQTRKGVWLVDLRFGEYREWDKRGLELRPLGFAWEFQIDGRGDPLKKADREMKEMKPMLGRMWGRIWGFQDEWSDRPRLIGNPAVPQEYLGTVR
ncbi:metal-dependent hydrolase [Haloferula chungangensis]|uniref:Metal-dependent hydrolase n=1 Tax=Haloferula chungangensis TaxID=1048331 RepID=A0ABW2L6K3_9BACT